MISLKKYKLYLLDMDGTIYLGNNLFPQTPPFLDFVKENGASYMFLTNNSSSSADKYVKRLHSMGLDFIKKEDFLTSTHATIEYLKENYAGKKFYAFGTCSFVTELEESGIKLTTELEDDIDAIVMGFDTELTFKKLDDVCQLLVRGVDYIATHPDYVCPTSYGFVPDCGAVTEMLYMATGRRPHVIGKPQPAMIELALKQKGLEKSDAMFIGDRLYTDIACGCNAGIDTAFVLSGEGTLEDLEKSEAKPTYVLKDIGECIVKD